VRTNILVVDDEAGPREALRMILKNEHEVRLAASGPEALTMIRQEKPDLVFLDIRMPEMEGTEVLRRIKQLDPEIEVAMITAYAAIPSAQRAMRLGALDYLTKPFGVAEVEAVVDRALTRRQKQNEERLLLRQLSATIEQLSQELAQVSAYEVAADDDAVFRGLTSAHSSIEHQVNEVHRLSAVGQVAAEVGHDLNNFLCAILFRIELMLLNLDQSQEMDLRTVESGLQQIALAARDGGKAVKRISALADTTPYEPTEQVNVNEVLRDAAEMSGGRVDSPEQHRVIWDLDEVDPIQGSAAGLRTAFINLIINAHQAIPEKGEIRIRTFAEDDKVIVQVSDTGPGMSSEVLARLAEPFFTTKGDKGTGLGLTVAHKVLDQHNATMNFDSREGEGTNVTVRLPVTQPSEQVDGLPRRSVLAVDDQEGMLTVVSEALKADGFQVTSTASPREALSLFQTALQSSQPTPDVLLTDLRMPEMLGTDLAAQVKRLAPETCVVLLSGYLDETDVSNDPNIDVAVSKPVDLRELAELIDGLLTAGNGQ
jgi:CheY-like chemotaxis protein